MKILTIAICAYNMEEYIEKTLDSCIIKDIDKLEILIMNDGSTDRTAELCQPYCDKYPDSFILVNKENGGWGSNLNMAAHLAKGKYFKEMDADDWFETENLQKLVLKLEDIDADMVLTDHRYCYTDKTVDNNAEWAKYTGEIHEMKDIKPFYFSIWDAAFLTSKLSADYINLPKHTLYTDNLFIMYQLPKIETAYFMSDVVYNYRLGRDGQSVNAESLRKHYKDLVSVLVRALKYYNAGDNKENIHVREKFISTYYVFYEYFLRMKCDKEIKKAIRYVEYRLKKEAPELYKETNKAKRLRLIRMTGYAAYPVASKIQKMKDKRMK